MAKAVKATKTIKESKTKSVLTTQEKSALDKIVNKYELMFIVSPMLTEEKRKKALSELTALLEEHGASVFHVDDWGKRELAYKIKKYDEGYYLIYYFTLPDTNALAVIDQHLRLDQNFIRHLLLKRESDHEIKDYTIEVEEEPAKPKFTKNKKTTAKTPATPKPEPEAAQTPETPEPEPEVATAEATEEVEEI